MKTSPINEKSTSTEEAFVNASVIATHFSVTPRYILKLAADNKIPSHRLGSKCIRFKMSEVIASLEI